MDHVEVTPPPVDRKGSRVIESFINEPTPPRSVERDIMERSPEHVVCAFIAEKLLEPNVELITQLVKVVGISLALRLLKRALAVEEAGGCECTGQHAGKRKSPGGIWLGLLRRSKEVDNEAVAQAIRSCDRKRRARKWSPERGTTVAERRFARRKAVTQRLGGKKAAGVAEGGIAKKCRAQQRLMPGLASRG